MATPSEHRLKLRRHRKRAFGFFREIAWNLRELAEEAYQARGGEGETLPGGGAVSGYRRVDMRFAEDGDGAVYVLSKSDGMIRRIVGAR